VGQLELIGKGKRTYFAGPCDQLVQILWRMQWAHAKACTRKLTGCCGPAQLDRQGEVHLLCGPMRTKRPNNMAHVMGPVRADIGKSELHSHCGPNLNLSAASDPLWAIRMLSPVSADWPIQCYRQRTIQEWQQGQLGVFVVRQSLIDSDAIGSTALDLMWAKGMLSAVLGDWPTQCHRYHLIHD
jgi:hypothetical protein